MKLLKQPECQFSGCRGNEKELTMIVEEQGIGFWTRVQLPSAPLEKSCKYKAFSFWEKWKKLEK